jgi:hypothetical protein
MGFKNYCKSDAATSEDEQGVFFFVKELSKTTRSWTIPCRPKKEFKWLVGVTEP